MAIKAGWRGRFFEDFEVGDVYEHPLGRTVTTTDNLWFTLLTQNTAPIHVDHAYAALTEFGPPLVDSTFTVALVTGQSVTDISQNVFANLGWDEIRLPAPVFEGDTIYSRSEVLEKRGPREARVPLAARRWHRDGENHGLQPGGQDGHHILANRFGLQTGSRARRTPSRSRSMRTRIEAPPDLYVGPLTPEA
jgi:acyl dehydratase